MVWLVLTWGLPGKSDQDDRLQKALRERLTALGRVTAPELRMTIVFALTAVLWVTRQPLKVGDFTILPGWLQYYEEMFVGLSSRMGTPEAKLPAKDLITDSTIAMLMAVLLFLLPSGKRDGNSRSIPLMDWTTANRLPWDMIMQKNISLTE